jgi:hypothetical protein
MRDEEQQPKKMKATLSCIILMRLDSLTMLLHIRRMKVEETARRLTDSVIIRRFFSSSQQ